MIRVPVLVSPFTGGWLRLQCKGTIQIVNGCFQLTKIGVFRLTRNGDYRLTLTREVYAAYKKSRHKKEFRAEHAEEIAQHEAAKQAFDALGGRPIPKVAQLSKEYAALLAEKRAEYEEYKALRQEMITIRTAKQNVDRILGLGPQGSEQKERQAR